MIDAFATGPLAMRFVMREDVCYARNNTWYYAYRSGNLEALRPSPRSPSLVGLDARAPFMHDGCATTLADRFDLCGGNAHGQTAHLDEANKNDLIQYQRSL